MNLLRIKMYINFSGLSDFVCLFGFYDISTFVGYLTSNPFLYKLTVLFQTIKFSQKVLIQTIQFSMSIVFVYTQLNIKTVPFQTIPFSISTVLMSKTVLFQTIQFSISTQLKCKYKV